MAIYTKNTGVSGAWLKGSDVVSGTKAKLVSECVPQESVYEGKQRTQNIAKVRVEGDKGEAKNVNINKPSINALVDAFGEDSKNWMGHILTIQTEKVLIAGKRLTAMYFVPEGYDVGEDAGGYLVITKKTATPAEIAPEEEDIKPEDIPF